MRILILTDWFAPGYRAGGPIQSCVNFAFFMKQDYDISVLTTDTDHGETQPYEGITANAWITPQHPDIKVYYAKKATLNPGQLKKLMLDSKADYIYLNHLFSPRFVVYPLWLKYTGVLKSKVVLCPRGALYSSALAIKPLKKKIFIAAFRLLGIHKRIIFHATNEREEKAIQQFFPGSKVFIADNLPNANQPAFNPCAKLPGTVKCIFIGRIVSIKNLLFLLQVLEKVKSNVELSVVGLIEDAAYWKRCEEKIKQLPANIKVNYLGVRQNNELPALTQQHHLFISPTTGENFGHAIFEALLAGRPVLISDQTPWLQLEQKKAGWDIPLSHENGFKEVIEKVAGFNQQQFDEWAQGAWNFARQYIDHSSIKNQYVQLFS